MTAMPNDLAVLDLDKPLVKPVRVWLVDDNAGFRGLLAGILAETSGFDCSREFPSAEALLEALATELPPEVILLDNQMPGQHGCEVIRPIKLLAPGTRVLMLTTCFDSQLRQQVLRDGAADFLQKSFDVTTIVERIQAALARPVEREILPEKTAALASSNERFDPPASINPHRFRRPAWACATARLLHSTLQVRAWLSVFF
jgi:DNA-binding NarL/FixJ family response regulator